LFSCIYDVSLKAILTAMLTCCVDLKYRLDSSICGAAKRRRTSAAGSFHETLQEEQCLSVGTQPVSSGLGPLSSSLQHNPGSSTNHPFKYAILITAVWLLLLHCHPKIMYVALFQDCDAGDTLVHIAVEPNSPLRRRSYLCTGFDCYVVQEPCAMCAMAATHARVRRICYSIVDSEQGMLGGAIRLHGQTSLNHHYQVFHLPVA